MGDEKPKKEPEIVDKIFIKSKTLWGVLIGFVPLIATALGIEPPAELGALGQTGLDFLDATNELIGVLLVLWGRYTAPGVRLTLS